MVYSSTPCPFRYYLLPPADGFHEMHLLRWMTGSAIQGKKFHRPLAGIYSLLSVILRVFQFTGTVDGKNAPAAQANALRGHDGGPRKGRNEILANPT